tara:strand:- start:26 stop:265 length:240 start_codon:yes stop_codon:yes gene_type:complete
MCEKCNFYKKQLDTLKIQRYDANDDIIKLKDEISKLQNTIKLYLKKFDLIKQVIGCNYNNKILTKLDETTNSEPEDESE